MTNTPRILLAAPSSGAGKTTVTCALLQALVNRGMVPMACKSGPDYIDPLFHSRIIGAKSGNLDRFFTDPPTTRYLLEQNSRGCDVTVLEGAMGFYDGVALSRDASAYDLSQTTQTPVVLVVDARGSSLSLCAAISGFVNFRRENGLSGVILNRVSPAFYPRLKTAIETHCGLPVYGYLPERTDCALESRHLGLVTPSDVANVREVLQRLAAQAEQSLDIDGLLALAGRAPALDAPPPVLPEGVAGAPRIAVAQDEAFCFYYADNFRLLESLGGELLTFSPLHDGQLPECDGLYLGGGYPELHGQALSENRAMREQIRQAIQKGMPTVAECGGFLYLHERMKDADDAIHPMAGVIPGTCYPAGRLGRFGYITLTARQNGLLQTPNQTVLGLCSQHKHDVCGVSPSVFLCKSGVCGEFFACCTAVSTEDEGMTLGELVREIQPVDQGAMAHARAHWDRVAKPLGSLGRLEDLIVQIAGITGSEEIHLDTRAVVCFCADNGVVEEGVTQCGQDVTASVAASMAAGTSSVCRMAAVAGANVYPVDIGMAHTAPIPGLLPRNIRRGTDNFTKGPAMTREEAERGLLTGAALARAMAEQGHCLLAAGEMGIGNTTTSSAVISVLLGQPVEQVTGRGAGLSTAGLARKVSAIRCGIGRNEPDPGDPVDVLAKIGGLDIAGMAGFYLGCGWCRVPVILDGLISYASALIAVRLCPAVSGASGRVEPAHCCGGGSSGGSGCQNPDLPLTLAFAMYSKIPMPRVAWDEESMTWVFCFFRWLEW